MSRVALITGAASGIGLATARLLSEQGWEVIGLDRSDPPAALVVADWVVCDLARPAEIDRAIDRLGTGSFEAIVFSAGMAGVGAIDQVLRTNFISVRRMMRALASRVADGGAITLVSSGAGWRWLESLEDLVAVITAPDDEEALSRAAALCSSPAHAYNRSKELLCAMAAYDCLRHWPRRVRLNSVSPGSVATPLIADFTSSMGSVAMDFSRRTVGRDGTPEEIAEVIAFLSESGARWINGTDLKVDGGLVGALSSGAVHFAGWE